MSKKRQENFYKQHLTDVLEEVQQALMHVSEQEVMVLADALLAAPTVFVSGEGRSGLIARCFAMRLIQLGLRCYVAGETITPAAAPNDLLLAVSSSGETRVTSARMKAALASGVRVAIVTAADHVVWSEQAQVTVTIPTAQSRQFGGTLFEQAALLLLDTLVLVLQHRLGQSAADMAARHATLE